MYSLAHAQTKEEGYTIKWAKLYSYRPLKHNQTRGTKIYILETIYQKNDSHLDDIRKFHTSYDHSGSWTTTDKNPILQTQTKDFYTNNLLVDAGLGLMDLLTLGSRLETDYSKHKKVEGKYIKADCLDLEGQNILKELHVFLSKKADTQENRIKFLNLILERFQNKKENFKSFLPLSHNFRREPLLKLKQVDGNMEALSDRNLKNLEYVLKILDDEYEQWLLERVFLRYLPVSNYPFILNIRDLLVTHKIIE